MKIIRIFIISIFASLFVVSCAFAVTVKAKIYDYNDGGEPYEGEVELRHYASKAEKDKDKYVLCFLYNSVGTGVDFTLPYNKMLQFLQNTLYGEINYDLKTPKIAQSYSWDEEDNHFGKYVEHNVLITYNGKNGVVFDAKQITTGVISVINFDISGEEHLRVGISHSNYKKLIDYLLKVGKQR